MGLTIQIVHCDLHIYRDTDSLYSIPVQQLSDTIYLTDKKISRWIRQLLEKSWIENDLLYQIASTIQKLHPNNEIDWYSTFYMVEKKDYVAKALALKRSLEKTDKDLFIEHLQFAHDKSYNDEIERQLSEIILRQLRDNGII